MWEKAKKFLTTLSKVSVVVIALATGYAGGELHHKYINSVKAKELQKTRNQAETSVALNERGEVLIIDRQTGSYDLYSDSVGKMIFNLYASKIYFDSKK